MTSEQFGGIIRTLLATAAGYFVAKGYFTSEIANAIVGAGVMLSTAFWSWKVKA